MIWMMTAATAALLPAAEPIELTPLERAWGGERDCDARAVMVDAGERVDRPHDLADDPHQLLMHNLHVLEAWESVRDCATVERDLAGVFPMFNAGQVLVAAARARKDAMPGLAAHHALDAFAFGNDAKAGPLIAAVAGQALHIDALDALGEIWPALTEAQRVEVGARLATLHGVRPPLDVEAERVTARAIADQLWFSGACLEAHEEALSHVEPAVASSNPAGLEDARTPSWSEWLTGCGRGVEAVTADYLEEEASLRSRLTDFVP